MENTKEVSIENLKAVYWGLESFMKHLICVTEEKNIHRFCGNFSNKNEIEFINSCHRAKQEIEYLSISKNEAVIHSYFDKMKYWFDALENWHKTELKEKSKINVINQTLIYIKDVFNELKHYAEYNKTTKESVSEQNDDIVSPFKCERTEQLFNYLAEKWDYKRDQKWADIWNMISNYDGYKAPHKNEYEAYIKLRFKYTGKFQYEKVKADSNRDYKTLKKLVEEHSKK